MMLPLAIVSFVLSTCGIAADISAGDGLSYDVLKQMKVSCHPNDTCAERKEDNSPSISPPYSCSCNAECSSFGTCCIDSPDRGATPTTHTCRPVDFPKMSYESSGYFMVQSCPDDSAWKHMCEGGLDKDGNVLMIAPVTSLDTNTTYKNYYCFRCNELTDRFLFWKLNLMSGFEKLPSEDGDYKVTYKEVDNTWYATEVNDDAPVNVKLQFLTPDVTFHFIGCNPAVISGCPDSWRDDSIRKMCNSYTAILYKSYRTVYRNVHCALCNSEPLDDQLSCMKPQYSVIRAFSFSHLIDINRASGDEIKKKCKEGEMWDPYGKKCRKLSCALPGYVIKDGKCAAP